MEAKCKKCGDTNWLLEKDEHRFYYAIVSSDELRWIEESKKKKISEFRLICSKCGGLADDFVDLSYMIKSKPLKVVWQTNFWDNLGK